MKKWPAPKAVRLAVFVTVLFTEFAQPERACLTDSY